MLHRATYHTTVQQFCTWYHNMTKDHRIYESVSKTVINLVLRTHIASSA